MEKGVPQGTPSSFSYLLAPIFILLGESIYCIRYEEKNVVNNLRMQNLSLTYYHSVSIGRRPPECRFHRRQPPGDF